MMIRIKNALGSVTLMMSTFFLSDKFGSLQQIRQGVAKKKIFSCTMPARTAVSLCTYTQSRRKWWGALCVVKGFYTDIIDEWPARVKNGIKLKFEPYWS